MSTYRLPAFVRSVRSDYLTAYMNGELYEVDGCAPEALGHLGVSVALVGCMKADGWTYGPGSIETKDIAIVEYVAGVEERYRRQPFYIEQRWLRQVTS